MVSVITFGTAACGDNADKAGDPAASSSVDTGETIPGLKVSGPVGSEPTVKIDAPLKIDSTKTQVVQAGDGAPVVQGKDALLSIYVANGKTGKKAASTYDQGTPAKVTMADGQLFPSLLQALVGKPEGSRVAVAATVTQTYGSSGAKQLGLTPQDSVLFVVDIVSVAPSKVLDAPSGQQADVPKNLPTVEEKGRKVTGLDFSGAPAKPAGKLQVIPLVKGDGPPVRDDSLVTFNYFGEVWGAKSPFDESYSKQPVTFGVGINQLIKAWDQGLVGVPQGSRVMIIAPPKYGYGSGGNPQAGIKGTDSLVFIVDVLGVG